MPASARPGLLGQPERYSYYAGNPTLENVNIGFRVASTPEPSTGLLVLAGLSGLALRQRRRG
jgi:hypothetical protein